MDFQLIIETSDGKRIDLSKSIPLTIHIRLNSNDSLLQIAPVNFAKEIQAVIEKYHNSPGAISGTYK